MKFIINGNEIIDNKYIKYNNKNNIYILDRRFYSMYDNWFIDNNYELIKIMTPKLYKDDKYKIYNAGYLVYRKKKYL